jgi:hypothetical protein
VWYNFFMDKFEQAFRNNFYQTQEFADFCAKIANIPMREKDIDGEKIYTLKNKNISIGRYSDSFCREMREKKIQYLRVLPEINNEAKCPSYIEYSIFHKMSYEEARKRYKTSFFHGLREGKRFPHEVKIVRKPGTEIIAEIYTIYTKQMERHNSFVFPISFFQKFLTCPSSFLFLIKHQQKIIAFFCCFQNQDNLYASIGGGHPDYFSYKSSNKLYDELIQYACRNNLNIHLGIGEHGSGYQKFKQNAGLVCYKTERFPYNEKFLKYTAPLLKFRITGKFLKLFSRVFPHLIVYLTMPFT